MNDAGTFRFTVATPDVNRVVPIVPVSPSSPSPSPSPSPSRRRASSVRILPLKKTSPAGKHSIPDATTGAAAGMVNLK